MRALDEFIATVTSTSEEDVDKVLKLLNPTSENEMGEVYEATLGYNPITYFDEKAVAATLDKIIDAAPNKAGQILTDKKEEVVANTIKYFSYGKIGMLETMLEKAVNEVVPSEIWDGDEIRKAFDTIESESLDSLYLSGDDDDDEDDDESLNRFDDEDDDENDEIEFEAGDSDEDDSDDYDDDEDDEDLSL